MTEFVDCVVVGAGVVGLTCAAALADRGREVIVVETADAIGTGTSSRNSEVIHAGLYYPAGSLKARLCREGRDRLYAYCAARGVAHRRTGKLIVAAGPAQHDRLRAIQAAALANRVDDLTIVTAVEIEAMAPAIAGDLGLFSPSTGIIDSRGLMLALEGELTNAGGTLALRAPVIGGGPDAEGRIRVETGGGGPMTLSASDVVNAAGLQAQIVARALGTPAGAIPRVHYAIGQYYRLSGRAPCDLLVYPVPEDGGLGVHLTLDLGGRARFGPDVRWIDRVDYRFDDSRFAAFCAAIGAYYPALDPAALSPDYTGIRPKLSGPGEAAADFRIDGPSVHGIAGLVNLFGIESPGLTAALAIADHVAQLVGPRR